MSVPFCNRSLQCLLSLPPERSHALAIAGLKGAALLPGRVSPLPGRITTLLGKPLCNPIGLAAGLDKNAEAVLGLARCGFGFVEVGTVTPLPQPGNPQPRLFRLPEYQALINRMGFNNDGMQAMARRLARVRSSNKLCGTLLGVNLGKNKDTPNEDAASDYLKGMDCLYGYADYFTINLSSPNTPGLRSLQHGDALRSLLSRLKERQLQLAGQSQPVPLMLKVAPDLSSDDVAQIAEQVVACAFDGVIATNTTLSREAVAEHRREVSRSCGMRCMEIGGLPKVRRATCCRRAHKRRRQKY